MRIKQRKSPESIPEMPGIPPVLRRLFAVRGITCVEELNKQLQAMLPFDSLKGVKDACERLEKALTEKQSILIIGDFDADGATSTALAVSALKLFGAAKVDYLVPNRFEFGYGLTPAIVEVAARLAPDLIITVDNGIASIEGVAAAKAKGIDVLITDHHLPGEQLPEAVAIVNPNQPGCVFPSKSIAGVGVIFYTMIALRRYLIEIAWFKERGMEEPNMAQLLDLVALGTVADVVALDQNNRILVNQGLSRIRQGLCRPGIKALIEVANREPARIRESDLGYALAPRLNAAGRLDDMSLGIECLLTEDPVKAKTYAEELDSLNVERRQIEAEMKEQALHILNQLSLKQQQSDKPLPLALCLFDPSWHQGVIGILAGRIKDRYHRPVIALAQVSEIELKGSARSVSGVNIRDVLAKIDTDHPGLLTKFGGHAMAAGLSMKPASLKAFEAAFAAEVAKILDPAQCEGELLTDGPLAVDEINLETAYLLQEAGPWGQQFPEPLFDNVFEVLDQRLVGQHHLKLSLAKPGSREVIDAIAFNVDLKQWPNHRARQVHLAYKLDVNVYQGRSKLQLMVEAMQAVES